MGPVVLIFLVCIGILYFALFQEYLTRYSRPFYDVLAHKETVFKSTIAFSSAVSVVSGLFGPFPTILPFPGKENLSVSAGSLILKIFISAYFFVGAYFAYKARNAVALGMAIFCLLEIGSLMYLFETFELRKGFPHIAFFALIAIYGFEKLKTSQSKYNRLKKLIFTGNLALAGAIFSWNILRF